MTQNDKTELKNMTGSIRAKLADNSNVLQGIIDNPGNLSEQLGDRITECNNLIGFVDAMDTYIDEHTE